MPPAEPKFPNPPLDEIDPGTLLTVAQAAAHFGVKPVTIRQWVHRGKITHVPVPGNGPRLYHLKPLAEAERDAWENGADRTKRGGRHPDFKPCAEHRTRPRALRMVGITTP
ncbi:helix-turn-helix domain-containing protein [Streptomyces griseoincarnatus]